MSIFQEHILHYVTGRPFCQKIYRHFIRGKAAVDISGGEVKVTYPRKARNPILRNIPGHRLPQSISRLDDAGLKLMFQ